MLSTINSPWLPQQLRSVTAAGAASRPSRTLLTFCPRYKHHQIGEV